MKFLILLLSISLVSCNSGGGNAKPKNEDENAFYALGSILGARFKGLDLTEREVALITTGLMESAKGKSTIDVQKYQPKIQEIFNGRMQKKTEKVKAEGSKFIEKFLKDGGKKTDSGLAYKITEAGSSKKPQPESEVEVHYHGTLLDGTVFDSSKDRGKTVTFPLNRVIKGWTEGLQLIGEGGKITLIIPSDLAYGDHGAPPKIPGGATLKFEVELFKIKEAEKAPTKKK